MKASVNRFLFVATLIVSTQLLSQLRADESRPAAEARGPGQPAAGAGQDPAQNDAEDVLSFTAGTAFRVRLNTLVAQTDGLIGVDAAQVDDVLRSHLGLAEGKGVLITAVKEGGPAAKAGLQKNDVLVSVADQEIAGPEALDKLLEPFAEKPVPITFMRSGHKQTVTVTPKSATARLAVFNTQPAEPRFWLGVGLASADDTLRSHLSIPAGEGLVVTSVDADSPAATAGVMVNDVLLKLDGKALTSIEALSAQLQEIGDKSVALDLLRRGKPAMLPVTPVKKAAETWFTNVTVGLSTVWAAEDASVARYQIARQLPAIAFDVGVPTKPDLTAQIAELLEQVGKLQKSLEALDAAVKGRGAADTPETEKK